MIAPRIERATRPGPLRRLLRALAGESALRVYDLRGSSDGYGGHWQRLDAIIPDMSGLGGRPRKEE